MKQEERLIERFYVSLRKRDWKGMVQVYHPEIFFYDPVFGNLEGPEVGKMWEMLLSGAGELDLQFGDIKLDDGYGSCQWTATYVFSLTGRKVVNKGKAMFRFEDEKIIEHQDVWSFWQWSRQALGWKGWLFGWTSVFQGTVRRRARRNLGKFMKK
ncbi:MAG TPA: nuclear transport factor 2 family protein [Puia sp.]|nr:nuclear transport factor 2 family protein [Puia sp.]